MQAVILCGGKGIRLQPLTIRTPKPMVLVNRIPFLEHLIERLRGFGVDHILLLVGYLGRQIEEYFGNGARHGLSIEYAYENELLGTGGALKNAEEKLEREFLLLNGDTYMPIDYRLLEEHFQRKQAIGTITVYRNSDNTLSNNIYVDNTSRIAAYDKKNSKAMTCVDAGVMIFKKDVLNYIPAQTKCSLEEEIFPKLIKRKQLFAFPSEQRFYDMGTPSGLREMEGVLR